MALAPQEVVYMDPRLKTSWGASAIEPYRTSETTEMVKRALRPGCEARISQGPEIKAIALQLISAMTDGAQPLW